MLHESVAADRACGVLIALLSATISAMTDPPVERELEELAIYGLDYGIHLATSAKGETFQPALITRDPEGRLGISQLVAVGLKIDNVFNFACERLQELPTPTAAAVVMDGNVTLGGDHFDAVIVRVGKPATDQSHEFAQRYSRGGLRRRRLERVGNPGYAGSAPGLFA